MQANLHVHIQELLDAIWADVSSLDQVKSHQAFRQLRQMPEEDVIPTLLDLLWHDPAWHIVYVLGSLAKMFGPNIPKSDEGNLVRVTKHWIQWGVREGWVDTMLPKED